MTYWGFSSLRSASWLLLHILWVVVSLVVFAREAAALRPSALMALHKQDGYVLNLMEHYSSWEAILASGGAGMQLAVLGLFFTYHFAMLYLVEMPLQYHILDDLHAEANFFLPARLRDEPSSLVAGPDAAAPTASGLVEASTPAWTLPEDNRGLQEMDDKTQLISSLGSLYKLIFQVQAGRTLIMMLRMLAASMHQKRLAVVSRTMVTSFVEFLQCVPFFVSLLCFAVLFNIELGCRLDFFSTMEDAFQVTAAFAFWGDYKKIYDAQWEYTGLQRFKEDLYLMLFVCLFMFFLGNFVLAIVCDAMMLYWKEGREQSMTMGEDLRLFYKNRVNRKILKKWPPMERVLRTLLLPEEHKQRAQARSGRLEKRPTLMKQATMKLMSAVVGVSSNESLLRIAVAKSSISAERLSLLLDFELEAGHALMRITGREDAPSCRPCNCELPAGVVDAQDEWCRIHHAQDVKDIIQRISVTILRTLGNKPRPTDKAAEADQKPLAPIIRAPFIRKVLKNIHLKQLNMQSKQKANWGTIGTIITQANQRHCVDPAVLNHCTIQEHMANPLSCSTSPYSQRYPEESLQRVPSIYSTPDEQWCVPSESAIAMASVKMDFGSYR